MKKTLFIVLSFFLVLIAVYIIMVADTNEVFNYARDVMLGKYDGFITNDTPLEQYNIKAEYSNFEIENVQVEMNRCFVLHNFKKGFILAKYKYAGYNKQGEIEVAGEQPKTKWIIEKKDGKWMITDITEYIYPVSWQDLFNR